MSLTPLESKTMDIASFVLKRCGLRNGPLARHTTHRKRAFLKVENGHVGDWGVDAVFDVLTDLTANRRIAGFDGENIFDSPTESGRILVRVA